MPFGPLVTLILLTYLLFLGVILTFWFVLSPGPKVDEREAIGDEVENERRSEDARSLTPAERRRAPSVYTRDEVRGANARDVSARGAGTRGAETKVSEDTRGADAGTNVRVAKAPTKRTSKKNDAFEDFIRSKNDDFEF